MKCLFLSLILLLPSMIVAQKSAYNLPTKEKYALATISLADYSKISCKDLVLSTDSVYYYDLNASLQQSLALDKVNYLRVNEGTNFVKGMVFGVSVAGILSVAAISNLSKNDNLTENVMSVFLKVTLSGAALGGFVGLLTPRQKTYYLNR